MSSPDPRTLRRLLRPALLALGLLGTAACGFQPLYGARPGGESVSEKLAEVDIANIPERRGQQLRNLLIDRFYESSRPGNPRYRLVTTLTVSEQKLALRKDASAERAQLVVNAPYQLIDTTTGKVAMGANARSLIGYNVLEQQYGALAAVDHAYDRALLDISNQITGRVAAFLGRPEGVASSNP
jgi:LPS-assembly lipoprotein